MKLVTREKKKQQILETLALIGGRGATTAELAKQANIERHTLAKYLKGMHTDKLVESKQIGKSMLWYPANPLLQDMLSPSNKTNVEKFLLDMIMEIPAMIAVIDKDFKIQFMNQEMINKYQNIVGKVFYKEVLGQSNPLKIKQVQQILNQQLYSAEVEAKDANNKAMKIKASRFKENAILIIEFL
ncbi:hypothetical protein ACFL1B_05940 [Nanoarchaeota archaeon]